MKDIFVKDVGLIHAKILFLLTFPIDAILWCLKTTTWVSNGSMIKSISSF